MSGWLQTADKLAAGPSSQVTKAAQWFRSWTLEPDGLHAAPLLTGGPASYLTSLSLGFLPSTMEDNCEIIVRTK